MVTLTGNDLALAQMATALAIAWHKAQPKSGFGTKQIAKLEALSARLDKILDIHPGLVEMTDGECEFEIRPQ